MNKIILVGVVAGWMVLAGCNAGTDSPNPNDARIAGILIENVKESWATQSWYATLQQVDNLPNIRVSVDACGENVSPCGSAVIFTNLANSTDGQAVAETICEHVAAVDNDPGTGASLGLQGFEVDGGSGNERLTKCDRL